MKKCIISFILGAIIFGSICAYAATQISAEKVYYSENVTVKDKIDNLYTKVKPNYNGIVEITPTRQNQILLTNGKVLNSNITISGIPDSYVEPNGTLTITEKNNQINVNNYKYVDTSQLYTASEVSGEGIYWKKGTMTITNSTDTINLGFRPSHVFIYGNHSTGYFEIHMYNSMTIQFIHNSNTTQYRDISSILEFTSTGFKYKNWDTGYTYNYIVLK